MLDDRQRKRIVHNARQSIGKDKGKGKDMDQLLLDGSMKPVLYDKDKRFWRIPPKIYEALDGEFHFDFDPCPYPRPAHYNSLVVPWGNSNWVNPPFCKADAPYGGPSAFARKAVEEFHKGKRSVVVLPVPNSIGILLAAGAKVRYAGKIRWVEASTMEPAPKAWPQAFFILEP